MGLMCRAVSLGIGRHIYYLMDDLPQVTEGLMLVHVAEFLLILSIVAIKISLAIFLLRIL